MAKVLLEKSGISIELENVLDIQRHKELGYKEVKAAKAEKAPAKVPSLEVPEEKPKAKAKAKPKAKAEKKDGE